MTADYRESVVAYARREARRQIAEAQAAGLPLFTEQQVGVLHQQIRDQRAKAS